MNSAPMVLQDRTISMQRPRRALLYGLAIWLVWTTLVITAFQMLPADIATSALFVSMKVVTLAALVLALAVHYLRKVTASSLREGLLIGLSWTATIIALDLSHYLMAPFDIGNYFITVAPSYIVVPITTTLVMGYLKRRS